MKRLFSWLSALSLMIGCLGWFGTQTAMAAPASLQFDVFAAPIILANAGGDASGLRNKVSDKMTTSYGQKLDLNNTNLNSFRDLQGMYPTLAALIVKNAPFTSVDEVLQMPGLNEKQIAVLQANLDNFTVTEVEEALVSGDDRINNGIYR